MALPPSPPATFRPLPRSSPVLCLLLGLGRHRSLAGPPQLNQPSPSYVVGEQVPRLHCQMSGSNIASHVLSWYHQAPGRGPVFLLSHRAGEPQPSYGPGVSERFIAALDRDTNSFSLTIGNVNPADSGTYYCAIWFASQYIFGEGTRLIVGGEKKRAPQVTLLGPVMAEHPIFVCVAWGFSPEPVRLRWKVDGREPGPGEVAPPTEGQDGASIAGMLSLPSQAWLDGAQVTCRVEHETQSVVSSDTCGPPQCPILVAPPATPPKMDPQTNPCPGNLELP
uniref:Ig-like domain-containing protein n=1 Tax=Pelusios castaneus TaxID=367368 RepID=A0A8C8S5C3_9SAUR